MVRILKQVLWVAILSLGLGRAAAFSLLGTFEAYQQPVLTYQVAGDLGGPQNLGEEYRRNIPVVYYALNQNYIEYFGSNGIVAIDEAMAVMNGLTNVSSYSLSLNEFPLEARRFNYRAQALNMTDLKSTTLVYLAEEMGLAQPDRFTWTLRERAVGPGGCPGDVGYAVIKRNFEVSPTSLDQLHASSYVNGTLYSYQIVEACQNTPFLADAVEIPVDPLANTYSAVASHLMPDGSFLTGFTRDDVAGLRYMMRSNNLNFEASGVGTVTVVTNDTIDLLATSDLTALAEASYLNNAGALTALFPGLQIANTTQIFTNLVTTNTTFYFTNYPWSPVGSFASLASANVVTTNVAIRYRHQFANVITNQYFTNATITVTITNTSAAACPPFSQPGSICTAISQTTYQTNGVFGDYYLFPTNGCGFSLVSTQLVQGVVVNRGTIVATNANATNILTESFSQTTSYTFNQSIFLVRSLFCPENIVSMRQGIEQVRYVRRDYDSLLGRFFQPVTNEFIAVSLTNNTLISQRVQRVVTDPDLLVTAEDLGTVVVQSSITPNIVRRTIPFSTGTALPGLNGPGTLENPVEITFNKVGPFYYHHSATSLDEAGQQTELLWGSFDGSTNAPIVYPNGTSIENIENQILLQINPAGPALPNAVLASNYTNQFTGFTATGGNSPYTWSLSPGSPGLPLNLSLNPSTGKISGVPTTQGIFDISIRLTEANGRFVDRPYSITVTP